MPSITRKPGGSGKVSPIWRGKFQGPDGRTIWKTTKLTDSRKALAVVQRWQRAARLAEARELNPARAHKLLEDIKEITLCPATLRISTELFSNLLRDSTGTGLAGENFEAFCRDWLEAKEGKTAASTLAKYRLTIESFLAWLPERRRAASVASITPGEVERFRDSELRAGKSTRTVATTMTILAGLFNSARKKGALTHNPVEAIEPIRAESEERVPFSGDQIRALLAHADSEWRGVILFGVFAGLRLGDAASLSWTNIDLAERTLQYEAAKTSRRKPASQRSTVVCLHGDLIAYLESLPADDDPSQPLFPTLQGRAVSRLSAEFGRLMAAAGIAAPVGMEKQGKGRRFRTLSFHSTRHYFISNLANFEVGADVRKQMAGHASDEVHNRYVHLSLDLQRSAVSKLPSVL